jgi:RNA polymerase sigma-70 factor, ECF subfamily
MERRHDTGRVDELFAEVRPLLFSLAYRMLGSATEAEDIVQEALLRYHRETTQGTAVDSPKSYLSTITTRLCIDHLRSARVRRETYVGTWLPEPVLTHDADAERHSETADSLSMGFLLLLESLTPVERAVFLLREVFDFEYGEIGSPSGPGREASVRSLQGKARGARPPVLPSGRRGRRR